MLKLNWNDLWKGVVTAFTTGLAVLVGMLFTTLSKGEFPTGADLKSIGAFSLAAFLGYIIKNFFSNNQGDFMKKNV